MAMMQPMLEAACTLLQRGVNVLPVSRETKRPYLTSWKSWQENRQSLEQIRSWWQRYPQANVAIVTGAISGLCVVDA
ncbi:MAG: bifunctional DNA primase/polymerase, partial [Desulfovibrionaceae bacterium]|nr:bifunctional DNA primase/polymerase [Desulfovibrionaceae bacterium]